MAWMAWLLYIFVIYFSMMEVLLSENVVRRPGVSAEQEMLIALKPLDGLCVDNVRTHSWWTYAICFKKSILQVHVDSRTKALSERITLGQFVPEESTAQMQTYRTVDAKCNAPASSTKGAVIKKLPRTTVVHLRCCDVVVHLMRQSRHTVVTDSSGTKSVYWWPEQAAVEASEELRGKFTQHPASTGTATVSADGTFTSTGSNSGGGGYKSTASYRGSMSTATAEAYIHSVEEHSPCNYEITVCSELVCTANGGQSEITHAKKQKEVAAPVVAAPSTEPKPESKQQRPRFSDPMVIHPSKAPRGGPSVPGGAGAGVSHNKQQQQKGQQQASKHPPASATGTTSTTSSTPASPTAGALTTIDRESEDFDYEGEDAYDDDGSGSAAGNSAGVMMSAEEQLHLRERARRMFYHAYDSYMLNAFPEAELCPMSCTGGKFDLIKIPMVTLIDTLDTLVILGNYSEFRRGVHLVTTAYPSFNLDVNVSVFETTIRVLGGLLSAHLMAIDPKLGIYDLQDASEDQPHQYEYKGELLALCIDLGDRLLPAFRTRTQIPYGTVNLRYGVPFKETKIASTAGAGSLLLEFQILSHLSGDDKYGSAAYNAMKGLYTRKSNIGLLGKHINTETGQWSESLSGVGSNADSFYEYLLKAYLLFRDKELFGMFSDTYRAIKQFVMVNDHWFTEVDMFSGKLQRKRVENLDAFWPGVEAILGFSGPGAHQLNTFYSVWKDLGFLPEEIDYAQWQSGKGAVNGLYPLRPELIESTYLQFRTTGDRSWLRAGKMFLNSIERSTRTECGYATVRDVSTVVLEDTMPSFFLSETCKYMFLLFDEGNFVNHRPYIFSTEAHPFESTQIHFSDIRGLASNTSSNTTDNTTSTGGAEGSADASSAAVTAVVPVPAKDVQTAGASAITGGKKKKQKRKGKPDVATSILDEVHRHHHSMLQSLKQGAHNVQVLPIEQLQEQLQAMATAATAATAITATAPALPPVMTTSVPNHGIAGQNGLPRQHPHGAYMLPLKCRKPQWWDRPASYDHAFLQEINRNLRKEAFQAKADHPRKIRHSPRNVNLKHTVAGAAVGDGVRTGIGGTIRPSGRAGPLRLSAQPSAAMVSRITLVLLDLIQNLQADAEKIAKLRSRGGAPTTTPTSPSASPTSPSSSSSSSLPAPALVPKVTKLKWYETKSPLFSHDICTLAEQPNGKKSAGKKGKQGGATASSAADATAAPVLEPLKSVKVNMGPLGEFQINVYTDGFFIYSEQDDIQVEISNVGHSLVLLRENVQDLKSEVVMADVNAHATTTCRVQISRTGEDDGAGAVGSPRTATTIFDRPCSVANFGATGEGVSIDFAASTMVAAPPKNSFCDQSVAVTTVTSVAAAAAAAAHSATPQDSEEPTLTASTTSSGNQWWQWTMRKLMSQPSSSSEPAKHATPRMAIADRGGCLFEDKANTAAKYGVGGVVVRNSEDAVFIMAGKRDVEAAQPPVPPSPTTATAGDILESNKLSATVMLSRTDGDQFVALIDESAAAGTDFGQQYRIRTVVANTLLSSEIMGNTDFPQIYMERSTIFVLSSGAWGTLLKATKADDWQLFIMSKEDVFSAHLALLPPQFVHTAALQPVNLPHTVLSDPTALYLHKIQRKCPNIINSVVGGTVRLL